MFKRVLIIALCIILLSTSFVFAEEVKIFKDISSSHWAYKYIAKLTELGYLKGYTDGTFKPDRPVLRTEFVSVFVNVMNIHVKSVVTLLYEDLKSDNWAFRYAVSADRYFPGFYINGKYYFKPNDPVKREDVAAALVRYYNYDINIDTTELDNLFSDAYLITPGLRPYVLQAYKHGLMLGSDGKFNPRQSLTRAEIAALFYRILEKEGRLNPTTSVSSNILNDEWYKDEEVSNYDPNKKIEITEEMIKNNLITNYSFENSEQLIDSYEKGKRTNYKGWVIIHEEYNAGSANIDTSEKISGNKSVKFKGNLYQEIGMLKPNTDYTLIGHMKRNSSGNLNVYFRVSGTGYTVVKKEIFAQKTNEWEQFVYRFKVNSAEGAAYINFYSGNFSYIDDIILVETKYIKDITSLPKADNEIKYGSILIEPVEIEYLIPADRLRVSYEKISVNDRISFTIPTINIDGETYYEMAALRDNALIEVRENKHQYIFFNANNDVLICSTMSNEYIFNGIKYKSKLPVITYTAEGYGSGVMIPETYLNKLAGGKFVKELNNSVKKCSFPLGKINVIPEIVEKMWVNDIPTVEYYYSVYNDDWTTYELMKQYNITPKKSAYLNIKGVLYEAGEGRTKSFNASFGADLYSNCWFKLVDNKITEYVIYTMVPIKDDAQMTWQPIKVQFKYLGGDVYIDKEAEMIHYYLSE